MGSRRWRAFSWLRIGEGRALTRRIYTPHGYQGMITDHELDVPRSAVWSFMGSGKTVASLSMLDTLQVCGEREPALVIAPLRVAKNTWPAEALKWEHLRDVSVMPIVGSEAERRTALKFDASVYTVNFDNLPWLCEYWGERWPYRTVVFDEATRLSGFRLRQGTAQAKALGRVAHTKIKRFIELTGTPAPNGLQKLWGQLWFCDAGQRLGRTYDSFRQRWFQKSFDGYSVDALPFAQEQIQDQLRDICITIDAKDWFDLDAPIITNVYVDLPPKARVKYREMEREMFTQIDDRSVEAFGAAAKTQKCLQLANGAVYVDPDADSDTHPRAKEWRELHDVKLQALQSIVEEANGMPVLVSYEFKSDLARILKAFPKARQLDADKQTEDDWNAGKIPVLVAHPMSAGHGLNLQDGGNILVFFGHNWNLETYMQIIERIGPVRQKQSGHERPVFIYHIIARDTVDELVMARRESKRKVQDILLDAMKRSR
jgi:SNF2 family DNA or RNA helicase